MYQAGFTAGRVEATVLGTLRQESGQWMLEVDGTEQELRIETAEPELRDRLGCCFHRKFCRNLTAIQSNSL